MATVVGPKARPLEQRFQAGRLEKTNMHFGNGIAPVEQTSGMWDSIASRVEQQAAGPKQGTDLSQDRDRVGQVFQDLNGGDDIETALAGGEIALGQHVNAGGPCLVGNPAEVEAGNMNRPAFSDIAYQTTGTTTKVKPTLAINTALKSLDGLEYATPFILP